MNSISCLSSLPRLVFAMICALVFSTATRADLIGLWSFDGDAADASGNDNHGEFVNGAALDDDVPEALAGGRSLKLEGGAQHVLVPHDTSLDITGEISISAWVKPVGEAGWDGVLAKNPSDGSADNHAGNYELRIDNGSRVLHFLYQRGGNDDSKFHPGTTDSMIPPDVWTHVVVTASNDQVDGGDSTIRYYINGELVEEHVDPVDTNFGAPNENPLYIGSRADLFTTFDGFIDEVAVFNEVLDEERIMIFARGPVLDPDGLPDDDNDGLPNFVENRFDFLDPDNAADAGEDEDGDGLSNLEDYRRGSSMINGDTDGDSLGDKVETRTGVYVSASDTGTHPARADSDGDGLTDDKENHSGNFAGKEDPGTDPNNADTDGDGFGDFVEVLLESDPLQAGSTPQGVVLSENHGNNDDWLTADTWSDGNTPEAGKNYLVVSSVAGNIRTPQDKDPVFPGDRLDLLGSDATLLLANRGVAGIAALGVDGSTIVKARAGAVGLGRDTDQLALTAAARIEFDAAGELSLGAELTGSTNLTVTTRAALSSRDAILAVTNSNPGFSGDWIVEDATLRGVTPNSLGTGDILLVRGVLDLNYNLNNVDGTFDISGDGSLIILDQTLAFGSVTLNGGAIEVPDGVYDYDGLGALFDGGLQPVFFDGGGRLIIGGDSDADGLPDPWETEELGGLDQNAEGDGDSDGLTNGEEYVQGTDPGSDDTDGDGLKDGEEIAAGTDPASADTDDDGLNDKVESNSGTFVDGNDTGTDPNNDDTDGDGLPDGVETGTGTLVDENDTGTNPVLADTDGDGCKDRQEINVGTDPFDAASCNAAIEGLIGWWPFDGDAKDLSGTGNDGTIAEADYSDDVPAALGGGQALFLSGGQTVEVSHDESLDITEALTIAAWVKPKGNVSWDGILAKNPSDGSADNHAGNYELRINATSRQLDFLYQQGGANDTLGLSADQGSIPDGEWTHVAVTAEKEGDVVFYVNGEVVATLMAGDTFGVPNTNSLYIGNRADGGTTDFNGGLDDVCLFNRALGADEITDVMDGHRAPAADPDTDNDGLPDSYENQFAFLDRANAADAGMDQDSDGLTNLQEFQAGTAPDNADSDGDGLNDKVEIDRGTDALASDSDGDGLDDGVETGTGVFVDTNDTGTDPLAGDSDGDWASDGREVADGLDPNKNEVIAATVSAVSSELTENFDRAAAYLVDGSGIDPDTGAHGGTPDGSMWLNVGTSMCCGGVSNVNSPADGQDDMPEVTLDLGFPHMVSAVRIWNYNEILPGREDILNRGTNEFEILVSTDGTTFSSAGSFALAVSPGESTVDSSEFFEVNKEARYIRIDVASGHGNADGFVGLSEVQVWGQALENPGGAGFSILSVTPNGGTMMDLMWESEDGVVYDVEFSPDLQTGWNVVAVGINSGGATTSASVAAAGRQGFLRVRKR